MNKTEHSFNIIKKKQCKKFEKLKSKVTNKENPIKTSNEWFENMSNLNIPQHIQDVLSLGPKFSIEYKNKKDIPTNDIIANIEAGINSLNEPQKNEIRSKLCNVITNFKNSSQRKSNKPDKNFMQHVNDTKKFIKNNPEIIILKPDKSNKTLVMNKIDYDNKMLSLLNDKTTYQEIKTNPTLQLQKRGNDLINKWEHAGFISPSQANQLKIHNALPPKIYGLPKLHKDNIPMRPIVSCIQSPLYNLSKFLADILTNIAGKNEFYIKNSWQFKNFINNCVVPENYKLISLDVVSLYTNIPIDLARETIIKKWILIEEYTTLTLPAFIEALELTLTSTYFQFKDTFYKQKFGCAMGSPISSVIAQLVMEDLEETVIEQNNLNLPFFKRYVDDCITAVLANNEQNILQCFNNFHNKLQFTLEIENNNSINFLDLTLIREKDKILTKLYTKPTCSGRYMNYKSIQPYMYKKSVISGYADRAINLTSPVFRTEIVGSAKQKLINNGYPINLINKIFKNRLHKAYNTFKYDKKQNEHSNNKFIALPYVQNLSEKINKICKPYNITIAHKNQNNLAPLFSKIKAETTKFKQTNVIYKIPCNDCPNVYIGQTKQYLQNRINQHKAESSNITALKKHRINTEHNFNFNNTTILHKEKNQKVRNVLEMIYIKKDNNSVNDRTDIANLSKIYYSIL